MGRLRKNKNAESILEKNSHFCIQFDENLKGNWHRRIFKNTNPIYLEIGCGKGKFIIENALKYPNINFIAMDKFSTILVKVINKLNESIPNLKIISFDAVNLHNLFDKNEVSKIYLNFSDPWVKNKDQKKRLTAPYFLNLYKIILQPNGLIEFKTDNDILYYFSLKNFINENFEILFNSVDIYSDEKNLINNIQTEYEKKFVCSKIPIKKIIAKI